MLPLIQEKVKDRKGRKGKEGMEGKTQIDPKRSLVFTNYPDNANGGGDADPFPRSEREKEEEEEEMVSLTFFQSQDVSFSFFLFSSRSFTSPSTPSTSDGTLADQHEEVLHGLLVLEDNEGNWGIARVLGNKLGREHLGTLGNGLHHN
jgi:hypothetical protein